MPTIHLNGEARSLPEGTTVDGLLEELRLRKKPVAVEINREVVPRSTFDARRLEESDSVEIVTLVGGG